MRAPFLLVFFVLAIGSATGAREKAAVRNTTPVVAPAQSQAAPARSQAAPAQSQAAPARSQAAPARSQAARSTIDPRVFDLALGAVQCAVRSGAIAAP